MTLRTAAERAACVEATAVKHASGGGLGVGCRKVKLPQTIVPAEVNNSTYRYRDAMEMMNDMRRLRRTTGWTASWVRTDEKLFVFHMIDFDTENPDLEFFAQFEVKIQDVHREFWPGKYPGDPTVDKLRKAFFTKGGPSLVAQAVNETAPEPQLPETLSAWSRLLSDDDELV